MGGSMPEPVTTYPAPDILPNDVDIFGGEGGGCSNTGDPYVV
jgi:hypothetical protein